MKQGRFKKQFILLRVLAALLAFMPPIMIFPLVMALAAGETAMVRAFAVPMISISAAALGCFCSLRKKKLNLKARDGFLLVFITWVLASVIGAIPFHLAGLSFSDSLFESACTFATTGGTTVGDIEALPRSLLLWRSLAHWFGGIGIVLISVALMPLLGVGGFQLIKAEAPGPEKEKITPKVTVTAKLLWLAYCVLTLALFGLYRLGGMGWFDALCHSLATMASGGVSTRNAGIAAFDSPFIDGVSTVFMLLAGLNFSLYYRLYRANSGIFGTTPRPGSTWAFSLLLRRSSLFRWFRFMVRRRGPCVTRHTKWRRSFPPPARPSPIMKPGPALPGW